MNRKKVTEEVIHIDTQKERRKTSKIKNKIFERDNYECRVCGRKENLEIHHMLSILNGGGSEEDNLITLCECCHRKAPEDGKENNELYIKNKYEYLYNQMINNKEFYNAMSKIEKIHNKTKEEIKHIIIESLKMQDVMYISGKLAKERKKRASKGEKPCGNAPYGYKWEDGNIVINKEEAKIIELIFRKYLEIKSIRKLEVYLKENFVKSRKGKDFSTKTILDILRNDFYKGIVRHGDMVTTGEHKPIVSKIIFGKVQNLLNENRRNK